MNKDINMNSCIIDISTVISIVFSKLVKADIFFKKSSVFPLPRCEAFVLVKFCSNKVYVLHYLSLFC